VDVASIVHVLVATPFFILLADFVATIDYMSVEVTLLLLVAHGPMLGKEKRMSDFFHFQESS
jgi:hypothetical protein